METMVVLGIIGVIAFSFVMGIIKEFI